MSGAEVRRTPSCFATVARIVDQRDSSVESINNVFRSYSRIITFDNLGIAILGKQIGDYILMLDITFTIVCGWASFSRSNTKSLTEPFVFRGYIALIVNSPIDLCLQILFALT
ncbi:hypothetical protein Pgin01_02004 [Porphyromonas gingivalis]